MRRVLWCLTVAALISVGCYVYAQGRVGEKPVVRAGTPVSAYPPGMRVVVGSAGALVRSSPSGSSGCAPDNHACVDSDALKPGVQGTVQADKAVYDEGGFYWVRTTFDTGITGWVSGLPPYVEQLVPPTMVQKTNFSVVADYAGAALTDAACINDGVKSAATRELQSQPDGSQQGLIRCAVAGSSIATGNHITVVQAINANGTAASNEFQFAVVAAPNTKPVPTTPTNLRITQ